MRASTFFRIARAFDGTTRSSRNRRGRPRASSRASRALRPSRTARTITDRAVPSLARARSVRRSRASSSAESRRAVGGGGDAFTPARDATRRDATDRSRAARRARWGSRARISAIYTTARRKRRDGARGRRSSCCKLTSRSIFFETCDTSWICARRPGRGRRF